MKLTTNQANWLDKHGGRNINDVYQNELGLFVYMRDGQGGEVKVYIPKDNVV